MYLCDFGDERRSRSGNATCGTYNACVVYLYPSIFHIFLGYGYELLVGYWCAYYTYYASSSSPPIILHLLCWKLERACYLMSKYDEKKIQSSWEKDRDCWFLFVLFLCYVYIEFENTYLYSNDKYWIEHVLLNSNMSKMKEIKSSRRKKIHSFLWTMPYLRLDWYYYDLKMNQSFEVWKIRCLCVFDARSPLILWKSYAWLFR